MSMEQTPSVPTEFERALDRVEKLVRVIVMEIQTAEQSKWQELEEAAEQIRHAEEELDKGNRVPYLWLFEHFTENARKIKERPAFTITDADRLAAYAGKRLEEADAAFLAEYKNCIAYLYDIYGAHSAWHALAVGSARKFYEQAGVDPAGVPFQTDQAAADAEEVTRLLYEALAVENKMLGETRNEN